MIKAGDFFDYRVDYSTKRGYRIIVKLQHRQLTPVRQMDGGLRLFRLATKILLQETLAPLAPMQNLVYDLVNHGKGFANRSLEG